MGIVGTQGLVVQSEQSHKKVCGVLFSFAAYFLPSHMRNARTAQW